MTILEAIEEVKAGIIPGIRGVGCAAIVMQDGRQYGVVSAYLALILERYTADGELAERVTAGDVEGVVDRVEWHVDQLGGVVGHRS